MLTLSQLSSAGPILDSRSILPKSNRRYARALAWIEYEMGIDDKEGALWKLLNHMPPKDRIFLLRCAGVRSNIDSLCTALHEPHNDQHQLTCLYESICVPFEEYVKQVSCSSNEFEQLDWLQIGADFNHVLIEPLPFVVSAWGEDIRTEVGTKWSEAAMVSALFQEHMASTVGAEQCALRPMSCIVHQRLESVLEPLAEFHPAVMLDLVMNVRHICMIDFCRWDSMDDDEYREIGQSVSSHLVPSTCFFSYHSLTTRERLVEALYHEALHKKLSNTILAYSILRADYDSENAVKFCADWNVDSEWNSNTWEFDRALYAYHVYVHLYLFYAAVIESDSRQLALDRDWCIDRHASVKFRAHKLGVWVEEHKAKYMSQSGLTLLKYLNEAMQP